MNEVMIQMVEKPSVISETPVKSKEEAIDICMAQISSLSQETLIVINFDSSLAPINMCTVGIGTPSRCSGVPSDVFKSAILSNAKYIVVAHNHPYPGTLQPSLADLELSEDLAISGYHLGIMVWDFLICQGHDYMSFQDCRPEFINVEKILKRKGYRDEQIKPDH